MNHRSNSTIRDIKSNVTLERNGSMPNLSAIGNITRIDQTTRLRFEYDKYLASVEAKYMYQMYEKKINSNINEQKEVFREELNTLNTQFVSLTEELKLINELKIEKENLNKKLEVLEMLNKAIVLDDSDEEIMSLFSSTASKVILKNFKQMDETDLNAVKVLLNEIMEPLKLIDYGDKINKRIQLKDLLIKMATLTKELNGCKLKCENSFDKQESLQNCNSSLQILNAQFGENPDTTLLPSKSNLMENISIRRLVNF